MKGDARARYRNIFMEDPVHFIDLGCSNFTHIMDKEACPPDKIVMCTGYFTVVNIFENRIGRDIED